MTRKHHEQGRAHGGHRSMGNLVVAFLLNLIFTIIEVVGGLWTNSIAILSDAVHDAGDSLSIGLAWWLQKVSKGGSDKRYSYGYRGFSVLGALITGTVLLIGIGFILGRAIPRLIRPEEVNAPGMIWLAVAGIIFNGLAVLRTRQGGSITETVVSWHLLEDVLGWVAVLLGAAAMSLWRLPIIDPLLSIGISLFVLYNVARNLRTALRVFLQRTPPGFDLEEFERKLAAIPCVRSSHHTHAWSLDGEKHVLTTHLVMAPESDRGQIAAAKQQVRKMLDEDAFEHVTVDVELEGEPCLSLDGGTEPSVP